MRKFTYKLATYLSTGDIDSFQNALLRESCGISRDIFVGRIGLAQLFVRQLGLGLAFSCMLPVDMQTRQVKVCA